MTPRHSHQDARVSKPQARHVRVGVLALALLASVCGGDGRPPSEPSPIPDPATAFRVAILLGGSQRPAVDHVRRVFAKANDILFEKTGQRMIEIDLVTAGSGPTSLEVDQYMRTHTSAPPDGVLALWDDAAATSNGGYSVAVEQPPPYRNRFPSPVVGTSRVYVAVVHFAHMYARCGYNNAGNRIGDVSSGGECRNRSGVACVHNGRYWTCPETLAHRYAEPDVFTASSIVHEFMHPFGAAGNFDHYGTPQCIARTGMSQADAQNLDLAQQNCVMCPDVFPKFRP